MRYAVALVVALCCVLAGSSPSEARRVALGDAPNFYYGPAWSPDCKKIAYGDARHQFWVLDVASGKSAKVDHHAYYEDPVFDPAWSPDSRWLAYTKMMDNKLRAAFLYDAQAGNFLIMIGRSLSQGDEPFQLCAWDGAGDSVTLSDLTFHRSMKPEGLTTFWSGGKKEILVVDEVNKSAPDTVNLFHYFCDSMRSSPRWWANCRWTRRGYRAPSSYT